MSRSFLSRIACAQRLNQFGRTTNIEAMSDQGIINRYMAGPRRNTHLNSIRSRNVSTEQIIATIIASLVVIVCWRPVDSSRLVVIVVILHPDVLIEWD
jgi:hypothetical protein